MVHAVRVPARHAIYFVMGDTITKPGWTVEPGAWLDIPINTFYSMRGLRPEPAICQAIDDPLHYKVYMDPEQAEPEEWQDTGLSFGGTFSEDAWRDYAPSVPAGEAVPSDVSDAEVEAWENAMRNILRNE